MVCYPLQIIGDCTKYWALKCQRHLEKIFIRAVDAYFVGKNIYLNKSWWCLLCRRNMYSVGSQCRILSWERISFLGQQSEKTATSTLCRKQVASFFFPMLESSKNVLVRSFSTSMYASTLWCGFRTAHIHRLRVAYYFGCRALNHLSWQASVVSHKIQCEAPTFEAILRKNMHLFLERCKKPNKVWLRALMQSDCLHLSLFFEHYNRSLLCDWVPGRYSVCSFEDVCRPQRIRTSPGPGQGWILILPCDFRVLLWT